MKLSISSIAQDFNQQYTDTMNYIFQKVDKSKITTGLLADYGLQIMAIEAFNGVPADSNYVSITNCLYQILFRLQRY